MSVPKRWKPFLTSAELARGGVFLALWALALPFLWARLQFFLDERFGFWLSYSAAALFFHTVCAVAALLLLFDFLRRSFELLLNRLPENLFSILLGLLVWGALRIALCAALGARDPIQTVLRESFLVWPGAAVVVFAVLAPFLEELLFRGVLFTALRRSSRLLAWLASVLLFCLYGMIGYRLSPADTLLLLPCAAAATLCYDCGASVWSCVFLRGLISALLLILPQR